MSDSKVLSRLLLVSGLLAACSSPEPSKTPERSVEERSQSDLPWTEDFRQPAVLLAREVRIEGPQGLLQHVATMSDPSELDRREQTRPEGFLQEITVRPESEKLGAEIRAQLDQLAIVATQRLSVLERPGPVDVLVIASGDAYYARGKESEQRGEILRFQGKIAR